MQAKKTPMTLTRDMEPGHAHRPVMPRIAAPPRRRRLDAVRIEIHDTPSALRSDWLRLEQAGTATLYQSYAWLDAYWRNIGLNKAIRCTIAAGYSQTGECLFILPLAVRRAGPFNVLCWLGEEVSAYGGGLFASTRSQSSPLSPRLFPALWRKILAQIPDIDAIHLRNMAHDWPGGLSPMAGLLTTASPNSTYVVALGDDFESFYAAKRGPRTRARSRRKDIRLQAMEGLKFERMDGQARARPLLTIMAAQKNASLARIGARPVFTNEIVGFLDDLVGDGRPGSPLVIHVLSAGDQVLATVLGGVHGDTFHGITMTMADGEVRRLSPGDHVLRRCINDCMERGLKVLDFGPGAAEYKRHWCDRTVALFDVLQACSLKGELYRVYGRLLLGAKKTVKNSPFLWAAFWRMRKMSALLRRRKDTL